jgi:hypothetical protein
MRQERCVAFAREFPSPDSGTFLPGGLASIPVSHEADRSFGVSCPRESLSQWSNAMLREPADCRSRLARFLASNLVVVLAAAGCGGDNQSGDATAVAKDAPKRTADMYNFMKEKGKVKAAPKPASTDAPKSE